LKLKTNIATKLNHVDTWHKCRVTRVKNKKKINKIQKNQKLTRDINFTIVWSKITTMTKLNHFYKNKNQIETTKNWKTNLTLLYKYNNQKSNLTEDKILNLSLYQIQFLYKFYNSNFIIINIFNKIKLNLFKYIFCIKFYLNFVLNIYISIIYR